MRKSSFSVVLLLLVATASAKAATCTPAKAGEYSFRNTNFPRNIAMRGNIVYVAMSSHVNPFNFRAIDIANRSAPVLRGTNVLLGDLGAIPALEFGDNIIVISSSLGLQIFDISSPAIPTHITTFAVASLLPVDLRIATRRAYVIGEARRTPQGRLSILDLSAPTVPTQLGFFEVTNLDDRSNYNWSDVEIIGNTVFVSTDPPDIGGSGGGIRAIDVSNPASPRDLGHFADVDIARARLATNGTHLFALGPRKVVAIDVSNPAAMRVITKVDYGGKQTADDFEIAAGRAIVPDIINDKVLIYDVSKLPDMPLIATIAMDAPYRVTADERTLAVFLFNEEVMNLFDVSSCSTSSGPSRRRAVRH